MLGPFWGEEGQADALELDEVVWEGAKQFPLK